MSEDDKVHALSTSRRWGGNCLNAIQVIRQLLDAQPPGDEGKPQIGLNLLTVLPRQSSPYVEAIRGIMHPGDSIASCIFREENNEPAMSYVIKNLATASRTIISHNPLEDFTFDEFRLIADSFHGSGAWYHFEVGPPISVYTFSRSGIL